MKLSSTASYGCLVLILKKGDERLFGIANTIDRTDETRISNERKVAEALRLPGQTL